MRPTAWVLNSRPTVDRPLPGSTLLGQHDEWEATLDGIVRVRTIFLRGSECRFHCVMCDLWQYTHVEPTAPGAIVAQVQQGTADLAHVADRPTHLKLYNASSFFDNKNIPAADLPLIAELVKPFDTLIVENHPRLIDEDKLQRFVNAIHPVKLEIAMGLESVQPGALERLNKQMSVDDFVHAARLCTQLGIHVRAFVLLQPPWTDRAQALHWCQATIDQAIECGACHISVIPVRGGNGALEQLRDAGQFEPPTTASLEKILADNLDSERSIVTVDLWDWHKLRGTCETCSAARRARLDQLNQHRTLLPPITCESCDAVGKR